MTPNTLLPEPTLCGKALSPTEIDYKQMCLFAEMETSSVDLVRLRSLQEALLQTSLAKRTIEMYADGWKRFESWCADAGRCALPATSDTVALFATSIIDKGLAPATACIRVAAVLHMHKANNLEKPYAPIIRNLMSAAKRKSKIRSKAKAALSIKQIGEICESLHDSVRGARNKALLLLGFSGGFRRSELSALNIDDLTFAPEGVQILLRFSKTDQYGEGREVGICAAKQVNLCPVRALRDWLAIRGHVPGPLFTRIKQDKPLPKIRYSAESICTLVKANARRIGADPRRFGGHSLRAGCVTASIQKGASVLSIMQRTGHKSVQTINAYIRPATVFTVNCFENVL